MFYSVSQFKQYLSPVRNFLTFLNSLRMNESEMECIFIDLYAFTMRNFDIILKLTMNRCHIHPAPLNVHRTVHSIQCLNVYHTNPKIIFARYHSEFMCCVLSSYS